MTPRILIVEDELLVAMDVEATLRDVDWQVLGPVPDVPRALSLLEAERPDAVCLDMNLNGAPTVAIAHALNAKGIPFVILTGYSDQSRLDPAFHAAPMVQKPFSARILVETISRLLP